MRGERKDWRLAEEQRQEIEIWDVDPRRWARVAVDDGCHSSWEGIWERYTVGRQKLSSVLDLELGLGLLKNK